MLNFLNFKCALALADINTGEIFINETALQKGTLDLVDSMHHESAHILSKDSNHGKKWSAAYKKLGGKKTNIIDIDKIRKRFGIPQNIVGNIGNISGIQQMLTDYNLLLQYRKFSQRLLGNEGRWELKGDHKIRLFPTPRGSFPVVIQYLPSVTEFRTPQTRELMYEAIVAYTKVAVGHARRKVAGMPSPEGGTLNYDGEALVSEGTKELEAITERAINLGEPLSIYMH